MRIVCSHDEASLLRIMCYNYCQCSQCALSCICKGDLNKLLYTDSKTAALITKDNCQAVSLTRNTLNLGSAKKQIEAMTTFNLSFIVDSSGKVIAINKEDGTRYDVSFCNISDDNDIELIT